MIYLFSSECLIFGNIVATQVYDFIRFSGSWSSNTIGMFPEFPEQKRQNYDWVILSNNASGS